MSCTGLTAPEAAQATAVLKERLAAEEVAAIAAKVKTTVSEF